MSFPQTTPVNAIRNGLELWRLNTVLESSGDIYESDVSGTSFVVGSGSDISNINVNYFDQSVPSRSSVEQVSVLKPLVGRLDALASQQYGTGQQARLFISSADLIPGPAFFPSGFEPARDLLTVEDISIDLLQYFGRPPSIFPGRNDRVHLFQSMELLSTPGLEAATWFVMPYYGRRYASIEFANLIPASFDIEVFGVNLNTGVVGSFKTLQISLRGPTPVVAPTGIVNFEITDAADGMFDLLVVRVSLLNGLGVRTEALSMKVRTSDKVGG